MTRPRRNTHRDANQASITRDLRGVGFYVIDTSGPFSVGDILVWGYDDHDHVQAHCWHLIELKTAVGDLTPEQRQFMADYPGAVALCRTTEEVLQMFGRAR